MSEYETVSGSSSSDHHGSGEAYIPALALVFSKSGREIAVKNGDRPTLPEVRVLDRFYPEIEEFVNAAARKLGVDLRVLRCLDQGNLEAGRPRLYSLEASDYSEPLSVDFRWTDAIEACRLTGYDDSQITSIRLECERVTRLPECPVVPWEWTGEWGREAREWVYGHVESLYSAESVTLTPIRSWSISSVMRVDVVTGDGSERLYFKASPAFFSREVVLTDVVAKRFPQVSPKLVAEDAVRGWMLMEDLGDLTLGDADSVELWCDAMRALARLQIGFVDHTSLLEGLGLERRFTPVVSSTLREWLQEPGSLGLGYEAERTEKALERIVPYVGLVDELCALVDSVGLPQALDHGDLDAGNIFVRNGVPVMMDWSDSSISSPLFTPALIPQVTRNTDLLSAYLEEWKGFGFGDRLEEAFKASKPIAALERAFHYHRNIVAYLENPSVDLRVLESYIPDLLNLSATELERYA